MTPRDELNRSHARTAMVNVLVEAGAGTGKTTLLVDRVIDGLINRDIPLSRMLLITFMDKAQEEMRRRVADRLAGLESRADLPPEAQVKVRAALAHLEDANITTIHGFCQRVLTEFGSDYGIPVGFTVLEAVEADRLWQESFRQWVNQPDAEGRTARMLGLLHAGLGWDQLTQWARQICDWPTVPSFTADYPDLETFVREYGARAQEYQSRARIDADEEDGGRQQIYEICRQFERLARVERGEWPRMLAQWTGGLSPKGNKKNWHHPDWLTDQKEWIHSLKSDLAVLRGQMADAYLADWVALISQDFRVQSRRIRFEQLKLTFDDLLWEADRVAAEPAVRRVLSSRYDLVMVDEFQDTDPIQAAIVRRLVSPGGESQLSARDSGRLFLVGDPKQSIYRFRRADVETYAAVRQELLDAGGDVVPITENFRSHPRILRYVNQLFESRWPAEPDPERPFMPVFAALSSPFGDDDRVRVRVERMAVGEKVRAVRQAEAGSIANLVARAVEEGWPVRGDPPRPLEYRDIALILPRRTGAEIYRQALRDRRIPVASQSGRKFFEQDEIRGVRHLFRVLENPDDETAAVGWLLSCWVGLDYEVLVRHKREGGTWKFREDDAGHPAVLAWWEKLRGWHRQFWRADPETVLDWALSASPLLSVLQQREDDAALANLAQLRGLCRDFGDRWGIFAFSEWINQQVAEKAPFEEAPIAGVSSEVVMSTVHQAKGLEWPLVIVANWGVAKTHLDPGIHYNPRLSRAAMHQEPWQSTGWDALDADHRIRQEAEGDRLLYVALTRARDYLWFYASFVDVPDPE